MPSRVERTECYSVEKRVLTDLWHHPQATSSLHARAIPKSPSCLCVRVLPLGGDDDDVVVVVVEREEQGIRTVIRTVDLWVGGKVSARLGTQCSPLQHATLHDIPLYLDVTRGFLWKDDDFQRYVTLIETTPR
jgi:hypothetical protein